MPNPHPAGDITTSCPTAFQLKNLFLSGVHSGGPELMFRDRRAEAELSDSVSFSASHYHSHSRLS